MSSYRINELNSIRLYQTELINEIDLFLHKTNQYIQGLNEIKIDFDESQNSLMQLDSLLSWVRDYKRDVTKRSRGIKPRSKQERMDNRFRGMNDQIRGDRRIILSKLSKLEDRIIWLRNQITTFQLKGDSLVQNRTIKLIEENLKIEKGKAELAPGGGVIIIIALLFSAFYKFRLSQSKSD